MIYLSWIIREVICRFGAETSESVADKLLFRRGLVSSYSSVSQSIGSEQDTHSSCRSVPSADRPGVLATGCLEVCWLCPASVLD